MRYKNSFCSLLGAMAALLSVVPGAHAQTTPPTNAQLLDQILATAKAGDTTVRSDDMVLSINALSDYRSQYQGNDQGFGIPYQTNLWPGGNVHYAFDPTLAPAQRNAFIAAARELEVYANLKISPRTTERDYIRVYTDVSKETFSAIGFVGGAQDMSLGATVTKYQAEHELLHALGVMHEQGRFDRDNFVSIDFTTVATGKESNFAIIDNGFNAGPYDFTSLMHAGDSDFAKDATKRVITVKAPNESFQPRLGQRQRIGNYDGYDLAIDYGSRSQGSPANDNFSQATLLQGPSGNASGTVFFATKENGEQSQAGTQATTSIWYSWTPTKLGPVTFTTRGSKIDTVLSVYVGSNVQTITQVVSSDDIGFTRTPPPLNPDYTSLSSSVTFPAQVGVTYRIAVNSAQDLQYKSGDIGDIQLNYNQIEDNSRYKISGVVKTNASPAQGLGGVTIVLTGAGSNNSATTATKVTNSAGEYTLANLLPGNYTLRATKNGYTFDPEAIGINLTKDSTDANFTATKLPEPVLPEMYVSNVAIREGNQGNSFVTFNVSMNQASKDPITVFFNTANGTASSTSDYKGLKGSFTFAPGTTNMTVNVGLRPDTVVETDETFMLKISGAEGAKIVDEIGVCTIVNDDAPAAGASGGVATLPTRVRLAGLGRKRI